MPKRFDCEDEPNEFMDMPCRCDCGKWFDLTDGYGHNGKVICGDCHEIQEEAEQLRERYYELDRSEKAHKREKSKITKRLAELGESLDQY